MFVVSVKAKKTWMAALGGLLLVLVAWFLVSSMKPELSGGIPGDTNSQRITFLLQYGWQVAEEPEEFEDITIPEEFGEVYTRYNQLQKEQNQMDLEPYAGKECRKWVYTVLNYPGEEHVQATLLVCEGQIIGGDISSAEIDGFQYGFPGAPGEESHLPEAGESSSAGAVSGESASSAGSAAPQTSEAAVESTASAEAPVVPEDAWPSD